MLRLRLENVHDCGTNGVETVAVDKAWVEYRKYRLQAADITTKTAAEKVCSPFLVISIYL